jgi:hypothetical protein
VGDHIPPASIGPGRGIGPGRACGPSSMGPDRMNRKLGGPSGKGGLLGKEPSMMPRGHGIYGRVPNVEKDGDPITKRSPNRKPGNHSFF